MAIVNTTAVFNYDSDAYFSSGVGIDADPGFGINVNQNIVNLNVNYETATGTQSSIVNAYLAPFNQSGSATRFSRNEQTLVQGMVTESININGITLRYLPRWSPYTDKVWNERPESVFHKGLELDMVLVAATGFEGEGDVMTQYGMEFREEVVFSLSIEQFERLYPSYLAGLSQDEFEKFDRQRPLEGDLIVIPFGRSARNRNQYMPKVFEILRVTTFQDGAFFQLGDNYQYKIRARMFELSYEDINFNPTVVTYNIDGTVDSESLIDSDNSKISFALTGAQITDSETRALNLPGTLEMFFDSWADNADIERAAQGEDVELKGTNGTKTEKVSIVVDDYSAKIWGGTTINNLDDI